MFIFLIVFTAVALCGGVGLFVMARRNERDIDYAALTSPQTDEERREKQLGVNLSISQTMGSSNM